MFTVLRRCPASASLSPRLYFSDAADAIIITLIAMLTLISDERYAIFLISRASAAAPF